MRIDARSIYCITTSNPSDDDQLPRTAIELVSGDIIYIDVDCPTMYLQLDHPNPTSSDWHDFLVIEQ